MISTIVEIIRAYQPIDTRLIMHQHLQQQKLLELTSRQGVYSKVLESTIVEIIRAYQPFSLNEKCSPQSTIVEIIRAYQPWSVAQNCIYIYNSRNYQSLLAYLCRFKQILTSTIVEIIRAYQPSDCQFAGCTIYNSRNYQSLLAPYFA